MEDLRIRFGRLLAANRRKRGLTQDALSGASGVSVDMIGRIETGGTGVSFTTIEALAAALQIDPAELFWPDIPAGALQRHKLTDLTTRLAGLSDRDLDWIASILESILKRPA